MIFCFQNILMFPTFMDFAESSSAAASRVSGCGGFSIRDYVRDTRNNGVARNWPFPQKYLELCTVHGISEVLPPIEPRGLETSAAHIEHVKLFPLTPEKSAKAPASPHESGGVKKAERELVNVLDKVQRLSLSDGANAKDDSRRNEQNRTTEAEADGGHFDLGVISKMSSSKALESTLLEEEAHLLLKQKDASPDKEGLPSQKSLLQSHNFLSESAGKDSVPDILFCSQFGSNRSSLTSNANNLHYNGGSRCKRRKQRQKHRKRSMQDICARAKPFSLEELERRNGLITPIADLRTTTPSSFSSGREEDNLFLKEQSISVIYGGKCNSKDASILRKHPRDENLAQDRYDSKRRQLIPRKSQGSKIKQQKGKLMISLMAGKSKTLQIGVLQLISEDPGITEQQ